MRALRHSLVWAVMLVLLAGHAVAADGEESMDAHVTGTLDCEQYGDRTVQEDDAVALHLFRGRCFAQMSDPRVSGIYLSDIQEVCFKAAGDHVCMLYGRGEVAGPDGTWVGTWGSVHDAMLSGLPTWSTMEGTGDYEGWTFWFHMPDQLDGSATVSGIIYEGPPPPWAETLPLEAVE